LVIRCNIKREGNKSSFSINGKPATKKAVVEYAKSFSIQIDNLCQFLPQDKVVEFAAMTPVELLKSTQRAVASQEMIDMHENLKELRQQQKEIQARQAADQETLQNLEGRQRMQEADVERMREREQIKERVRLMEAARPFARYRGARNKHREAKEKRKEQEVALKKLEKEVEPSLRAVNEKQQYQRQIDSVVAERRHAVELADRAANTLDKQVRTLSERGEELDKERDAEINSAKNEKQMLARTEGVINRLKKQMEEPPPELDISSCNEQIVSIPVLFHGVEWELMTNSVSKNGPWRLSKERSRNSKGVRKKRLDEAGRDASASRMLSVSWRISSLKLDSKVGSSSTFPGTRANCGNGFRKIKRCSKSPSLGLRWWSAPSLTHDTLT
jgi:hypothetical protein